MQIEKQLHVVHESHYGRVQAGHMADEELPACLSLPCHGFRVKSTSQNLCRPAGAAQLLRQGLRYGAM